MYLNTKEHLTIFFSAEPTSEEEFIESEKKFNTIISDCIAELEWMFPNAHDASLKCYIRYWQGFMYGDMWNYGKARRCYISAMGYAKECNHYSDFRECEKGLLDAEEQLKEPWEEFTTNVEYKRRKFIMPIADKNIAGCAVDIIGVFRMSNIPSCIKFPVGHPVSAQLYIGHPLKNELYVPYETSEEVFFLDKVHELCYLLQCLGAEEISITSIKGKSVDELYNSSSRVDMYAGYKNVVSGDLSVNNQRSGNASMTNNSHRTMYLRFDPMNKPYLPKDGLVWYGEQPEWQRLVNNRLNGNMLEYSEKLSTVQTRFVSSSEKDNIKADAKILWFKAGVSVDMNMNKEFKENIDTTWQIDVKFRSIREL